MRSRGGRRPLGGEWQGVSSLSSVRNPTAQKEMEVTTTVDFGLPFKLQQTALANLLTTK